jgi:hypothetical protein
MSRWGAVAALLIAGCNHDPLPDAVDLSTPADAAAPRPVDLATACEALNECRDCLPDCHTFSLGPPLGKQFPLCTNSVDPNQQVMGLSCDQNGLLEIRPLIQALWLANATDWNRGTVSKLDPATKQEIARYFTVTCSSLPGGSADPCDGTKGCCAFDDDARWQARRTNQPEPPHQAVTVQNASPSRTALDFDGELWIANRAPDGIGSVTKIAVDLSQCIDRNGNQKIDTSHDANFDGHIETDCNGDGLPDDLATVAMTPCKNGAAQEFFGLDDECVIVTINVGAMNEEASAVAAGPGVNDFGPVDAWVSTLFEKVVRIDGTSHLVTDEVDLPQGCSPFGMATDSTAIIWAVTEHAGPLCWFDPKTDTTGVARVPDFGTRGWGISIDRDQNIWIGGEGNGDAYRYTPDRSQKLANLSSGWWTKTQNVGVNDGLMGGGRALKADSRTQQSYFVWLTTDEGFLARIPASTLPIVQNDQVVDGSSWLGLDFGPRVGLAVTVDPAGDVWAINNKMAIHIPVDKTGTVTYPVINGQPMGNQICPAGDSCDLTDVTPPGTEAYSDFNSIALRTFTKGPASYDYIVDSTCAPGTTRWSSFTWDADVPAQTMVTMKVRTGLTPMPDGTWSPWTNPTSMPIDLAKLLISMGISTTWQYLQIELDASTMDSKVSPVVKDFTVAWHCAQ